MYRIKKHSTGNQYLLSRHNLWVRDFTSPVAPLDVNTLSTGFDYAMFLENEVRNDRHNLGNFDPKSVAFKGAVIVSDGYEFTEKHKILEGLPANIAVIAVNRTLVKWKVPRNIDFFVVNNPYPECMNQMPTHRYYPRCLVSSRAYPEFVDTYIDRGGYIETYSPAPEPGYASPVRSICTLDDYRSPICAAVNLAYKIGVTRLAFFCCDDSFDGERPAAVRLENDLWTYPQHIMSHDTVMSMAHWYKKTKGVKVATHSSGPICEYVPYISLEEVQAFFE